MQRERLFDTQHSQPDILGHLGTFTSCIIFWNRIGPTPRNSLVNGNRAHTGLSKSADTTGRIRGSTLQGVSGPRVSPIVLTIAALSASAHSGTITKTSSFASLLESPVLVNLQHGL